MKKRILFVDDETNVLSGLRRMLRPFRNEWDMHFAGSGVDALQRMSDAIFDVVVTDMRMPGMDGAELLKEVGRRYPETVRIILSGQSDQESIERSICRTHQYLSKPCEPSLLRSTVSRACALRDRLSNASLKRVVSQMTTLPSLPETYRKVLNELQSSDASIQRVAELIAKDVAMTTKLLQLINSSFFGLPRRVESPAHAAALLGLKVLKPVVLSAGIFAQFDNGRLPQYSIDEFSQHSIAVSRLAKRISEEEGADKIVIEDSELAGLVHDVGQLVFATNLENEYRDVINTVRGTTPLVEVEEARCGTNHADVGAYLLGLWGLPEPIVEAVAFHHCPTRCPADGFEPLTAVHIANVLAHELGVHGPIEKESSFDCQYLARLGISKRLTDWRKIASEMIGERIEA